MALRPCSLLCALLDSFQQDDGAELLVCLSYCVCLVRVQHNLPSLPNFIRAFNGTVYGNVPHLLEPIWSYLPEFIGDDFYRWGRPCHLGHKSAFQQAEIANARCMTSHGTDSASKLGWLLVVRDNTLPCYAQVATVCGTGLSEYGHWC